MLAFLSIVVSEWYRWMLARRRNSLRTVLTAVCAPIRNQKE